MFLLSASGARADDPERLRGEADRLRSVNVAVAARSRSALLELYALESRLTRAERRVAALTRQAAAVERRQASARTRLRIVRATLREAEARLALRLRQLYIEGDADPLAVLLGAQSIEDAITTLEGLGTLAQQDREIVAQVKEARTAVAAALDALRRRESELRALIVEAEVARAGLVRARAARSSYLMTLARERRWNEAKIADLTARAAEIESRAARVEKVAAPAAAAIPSAPAPSATEVAAPATKVAAPATGGRQMTVVATAYSLSGTTATGVPTGWGIVAVDPSVIPLGTRMTIPGYGAGVAADTGPAVRGAMIDVWFPTRAQALAWGRRTVTITLH